jgi:hypothetical protein
VVAGRTGTVATKPECPACAYSRTAPPPGFGVRSGGASTHSLHVCDDHGMFRAYREGGGNSCRGAPLAATPDGGRTAEAPASPGFGVRIDGRDSPRGGATSRFAEINFALEAGRNSAAKKRNIDRSISTRPGWPLHPLQSVEKETPCAIAALS